MSLDIKSQKEHAARLLDRHAINMFLVEFEDSQPGPYHIDKKRALAEFLEEKLHDAKYKSQT